MSHWQHRHFHAYFPAGNSWPSILGDLLSNGLNPIGSSWVCSLNNDPPQNKVHSMIRKKSMKK